MWSEATARHVPPKQLICTSDPAIAYFRDCFGWYWMCPYHLQGGVYVDKATL